MTPDDLSITSPQNRRIKTVVGLRRKRIRDRLGLMIIEEPLVIRRALAADWPLRTVYFCPERLTESEDLELLDRLRNRPADRLEFVRLSEPVMARIGYRADAAGLLLVADQVRRDPASLPLSDNPLVIVLDGIEKPGNLGAVLRSADGAGADGVLLCGIGVDLFNPNVLRASRGTVFSVPVAMAPAEEIAAFLLTNRLRRVATTPHAAKPYSACDLGGPTAILIGAEDTGLPPQWLDIADEQVRIPMGGQADSLNLATVAALLLYEAVRQRA